MKRQAPLGEAHIPPEVADLDREWQDVVEKAAPVFKAVLPDVRVALNMYLAWVTGAQQIALAIALLVHDIFPRPEGVIYPFSLDTGPEPIEWTDIVSKVTAMERCTRTGRAVLGLMISDAAKRVPDIGQVVFLVLSDMNIIPPENAACRMLVAGDRLIGTHAVEDILSWHSYGRISRAHEPAEKGKERAPFLDYIIRCICRKYSH